jgi:hypothetical protein
MTKQIINIGTSANKGNGDPLRTAFAKTNENFTELYSLVGTGGGGSSVTTGATAPVGPSVGDLWYDTNSGRTYVYYDASWVDSSPVDGTGTGNPITVYDELENVVTTAVSVLRFEGAGVSVANQGPDVKVTIDGTGGGLSISDFGFGFTDALDDGKITTSKLYNENPNPGLNNQYVLEVTNGGVIVLPDSSIINGSTIRGVAGTGELNYTGITIGPNSNDSEKTWMWVDHANAYISTDNSANTWTFNDAGALTFPQGTTIATADGTDAFLIDGAVDKDVQIYTYSGPTPTAHGWTFGTDGILTFPGAAGFQATFGNVFPVGDMLHSVNNLHLESEQSVTVNSGNQVADLETTWLDTEQTWVDIRDQDAMMIAPDTRPWDGMPSYEAYPVLMNYNSEPPGGGALPPNPNMVPVAKTASDAYDLWQEELTASGVNISVAGNHVWNFGADGQLTVPGIITKDNALQFVSSGTTNSSSVNVYGDLGRVLVRTNNGTSNKDWQFNVDGTLTVPGEIKTAASTGNVTIEANDGTARTWTFGSNGSLTLPDNSVIASYKPVTVISATTTTQTISDNASAAFIQFAETVDTANTFSTGTFTVPYTGYYQVNMSVYFSTTVTLGATSFLLIDTNLDFTKQVRIIDGGWTGSYLHYSTVISASASDAVRIAIRQVSGGDIDILSGSRLTIHRVSIG